MAASLSRTCRPVFFFLLAMMAIDFLTTTRALAIGGSNYTYWKQNISGSYEDASKWLNNAVPSTTADVAFAVNPGAASYTVSFATDHTANSASVYDLVTFTLNNHKFTMTTELDVYGRLTANTGTLAVPNINIYSGAILTLNSTTLLNTNNIYLDGGTIAGNTTFVNNGTMSTYDNATISANFSNNNTLYLGSGSLTLSGSGTNSNYGTISSQFSGFDLRLTGGPLNNYGTMTLYNNSRISGTAALNNSGGILNIYAPTSIQVPVFNLGGTMTVNAYYYSPELNFVNFTQGLTNSGLLQVPSGTNLIVGSIASPSLLTNTSSGIIEANGQISAAIDNSGIIRQPYSGEFVVAGTLTNRSTGTVIVQGGNTVLITQGLSGANAGLIQLNGGEIDIMSTVVNNKSIIGYGTLYTLGLTNNSVVTITGGFFNSIIYGSVTNAAAGTINISSPVFFTGPVSNAGAITISNTDAVFAAGITGNSPTNTIAVTSSGNAVVNSLTETAVSINGVLTIQPDAQSPAVNTLKSLGFGGTPGAPQAALDIENANVLIHHTSVNALLPYLLNAYQGGFWYGAGITSSTAAADATRAIAVFSGANYMILSNSSDFEGQPVAADDAILFVTLAGDADGDGLITADDYALLEASFLLHVPNPTWINGDFDYNGILDYRDYAILDAAALGQVPALAASELAAHTALFGQPYTTALATLTAVPEPATLATFILSLPLLMRRRARRVR